MGMSGNEAVKMWVEKVVEWDSSISQGKEGLLRILKKNYTNGFEACLISVRLL